LSRQNIRLKAASDKSLLWQLASEQLHVPQLRREQPPGNCGKLEIQ
jgi:hypothetical protein